MKKKPKKLTKEIMVRAMARVNVGQPKPTSAFQDKRRRSLARIADKERLSVEEWRLLAPTSHAPVDGRLGAFVPEVLGKYFGDREVRSIVYK